MNGFGEYGKGHGVIVEYYIISSGLKEILVNTYGGHSIGVYNGDTKDKTSEQKETLFEIAVNNSQVLYILGDSDVSQFY